MKIKEYFKVVLILPGNILVTIPLLIFLFSRNYFSYAVINFNSSLFYIAILFLIIGLWLAIWSVRTFYFKGGDGTPGPWKPISKLVIDGPYRYVRNPMLIGVFFLLLFESIFFSAIPIFYWFLVFFIGNIFYFKIAEERDLIERFGSDYEDYKRNVPLLFPKFSPYKNNF